MVGRSEEEAEAELVDGALDALRGLLEVEAERFEDVGRARRGGDRAVSVLGHARAGGRRHESRGSRDVEGARAVAAGPGGVDEVVALRAHREHVRSHCLRAAGDLVGGLALEPERDEETADLRRSGRAAHDLAHDRTSLLPAQVLAVEEPRETFLNRHRRPSRKLRASSGPSGVSTDSGWNWMPTTGSSRWRTAMTSPSSVVAQTSRESGTRVAASEW